MEERRQRAFKACHLDLARSKSNNRFDNVETVISKIPDLFMPACFRLAGEEDYFNKTKDLKLRPFRKQKAFETCISPESITSIGEQLKVFSQDKVKAAKTKIVEEKLRDEETGKIRKNRVTFKITKNKDEEEDKKVYSSINNKRLSVANKSSTNKTPLPVACKATMSRQQLSSLRKKRAASIELNKHYSRMRIKKKNSRQEIDRGVEEFDKLFRNKPGTDYPFANPMPDCMLTDDHIDNLREIIVSSLDIEWRMLTPNRPDNDYEEKYFDKLIQLHRNRYRSRVEEGYYDFADKVPFKHTRHTYLLQYGSHLKNSEARLEAKFMEKFSYNKRRRRNKIKMENNKQNDEESNKMNIPKVTLTSDEKSSEPIENLHDDNKGNHDDDDDDDSYDEESTYEYFSRFSRKNMRNSEKYSRKQSTNGNEEEMNNPNYSNKEGLNLIQNQNVLDDQVDSIISHLMNIGLNS